MPRNARIHTALIILALGAGACSRRPPKADPPSTAERDHAAATRSGAGPAALDTASKAGPPWSVSWPAKFPCPIARRIGFHGAEKEAGEWRGNVTWDGGPKPLHATLPGWIEDPGSLAELSKNRRFAIDGPAFDYIRIEVSCPDGVGLMTWRCENECYFKVGWRVSDAFPYGGSFLSLSSESLAAVFFEPAKPDPSPALRVARAMLEEAIALVDGACAGDRCASPPLQARALLKQLLASPTWTEKEASRGSLRWKVGTTEVEVECIGKDPQCRTAVYDGDQQLMQYEPERGHCGKFDVRPRCERSDQTLLQRASDWRTIWAVHALYPEWDQPKGPPLPARAVALVNSAIRVLP